MTGWIFGLAVFFWVALHTSQSLMDLADLLLVLTALGMAIKTNEIRKLFASFKPSWLWGVWLLVIMLGFAFGAPITMKAALDLIWEFRWIISFLSYIYLFNKIEWNSGQLKILIAVLLAVSIADLALFIINYEKFPRAGGFFNHAMPFAHSMGPAALLLLFLGMKKTFEKNQTPMARILYFGGPALASLLVVLTLTRGVWLGFIGALLLASAYLGKRILGATLISLIVVGGVFFASSEKFQSRVTNKTIAETASNSERLSFWKANWAMFQDYPVFGIGYSQNNVHLNEYLKKIGEDWLTSTAHAHNQYLHFLSGTGILGLLCFISFLIFLLLPIVKTVWSFNKPDQQVPGGPSPDRNSSDQYYLLIGVVAALLCFAAAGLTESNFSIAKNRFMFLFIGAIGYSLSRKLKKV